MFHFIQDFVYTSISLYLKYVFDAIFALIIFLYVSILTVLHKKYSKFCNHDNNNNNNNNNSINIIIVQV